MSVIVQPLSLRGPIYFYNEIYSDNRGFFLESYRKETTYKLIKESDRDCLQEFQSHIDYGFPLQENISVSNKDVLRGLHLQKEPFSQGKLLRVLNGSITDYILDLRKESETYGKHAKVHIVSVGASLWVPPRFAHGFLAMEDNTIVQYKCTEYYNKEAEVSLGYQYTNISIDLDKCIMSEKDRNGIDYRNL